MINLLNVHKRYGDRVILNIPAVSFNEGERYAVIGANGSGKSTLLKIIAGTLRADNGCVTVPQDISCDRGYMPQHPYIFGFSVMRNVTMALNKREYAESLAVDALKAVGMASFTRAKGKSLSGGEAQRVAIARLIAVPRKLLILDEPTSSTDIAGNDLVESAIIEYCNKTGCLMIFSTHSPAQAMRLSNKIIMLHGGEITENGSTRDVIQSPESREGYEFLQHWKI